ncbi:hypothetical protein R1sor_002505 [Riccia sorocarpa]|uniref:Uncharacterized protein n=1 Tax=Riccia sorocarpa TaxID=122646 RepID=A0ABD3GZ07_9MARC
MACFFRKRKGKGKLSDLPEEAEEGELMAQTPFTSRPKMLGKKSGPNVPIEVGRERFRGKLIELGIEAYRKLLIDPNIGFDTPSVEVEDRLRTLVSEIPGKFAENYDMWLKSP